MRMIILKPNEQVVYNRRSGTMHKNTVDAMAYGAWVNGNLDFSGQTLAQILKAIERHYNVEFSVAAGIDMNKRYTMNFKKDESIDNVLRVLTLTSGSIKYKKDGNTIKLS